MGKINSYARTRLRVVFSTYRGRSVEEARAKRGEGARLSEVSCKRGETHTPYSRFRPFRRKSFWEKRSETKKLRAVLHRGEIDRSELNAVLCTGERGLFLLLNVIALNIVLPRRVSRHDSERIPAVERRRRE